VNFLAALGHGPDGNKCAIVLPLLMGEHATDMAAANAVVKPLLDLSPIVNALHPDTFVNAQKQIDQLAPHGLGYYETSQFGRSYATDEQNDQLVAHFDNLPKEASKSTVVVFFAAKDFLPATRHAEACFAHRGMVEWMNVLGVWDDPSSAAARQAVVGWTKSLTSVLKKYAVGYYANCHNEDETESDHYAHTIARLRQLKRKYDGKNFFQHNNNIKP
jgi:hypothetical protein